MTKKEFDEFSFKTTTKVKINETWFYLKAVFLESRIVGTNKGYFKYDKIQDIK